MQLRIKQTKTTLVVLFLLFLFNNLKGQEFNFRHLSVSEGLSQSAVFAIAQDQIGYIWVGTADGLNRYNGYEFIHFRNRPGDPNSISDNFIYCLEPSADGSMWIGTFGGGLNYYNPNTNSFVRYMQTGQAGQIAHNDVYSILETEEYLFVGTYQGLDISSNRQHFSPINLPDNSYFRTHDLFKTRKGEILVAHDYGLSIWNKQSNLLEMPHNSFKIFEEKELTAFSICQFENGEIWIGTDNGILVFSENFELIKSIKSQESGMTNAAVTSIYQDTEGNIWIGSNGDGLAIFNQENSSIRSFRKDEDDEFSLSDNVVTSIIQDKSGVVWIGTYHGGINRYDRFINQFMLYQFKRGNKPGLSTQRVFAIYENEDGDVWVGTDGGGLDFVDHVFDKNGSIIDVHYSQSQALFAKDRIWAIVPDKSKNLWLGTIGQGLKCFNPYTNKVITYKKDSIKPGKGLSDDSIYSLLFDSNERLWIGTDVGLNCLDLKTGTIKQFPINNDELRTFSSNTVLALAEDKFGQIWAGTFGGGLAVLNYNDGIIKRYKHRIGDTSSLSYDKVMSIYCDVKGNIWVGTFGGGFNVFNKKNESFKAFTELDGLANDVVYGFLEDQNGYLWMSTNKGLSQFNMETENFRNFDESCNLQSNEFNQGAYCKGASGRMYFGGINGFNSFNPNRANINNFAPPMVIGAFKRPGEKIVPTEKDGLKQIELAYHENNIFFEFVAFNYVNAHLNQYRYILEGLNNDWIEAGFNRSASFTNLNPGYYTFRVQAANNDGVWNTQGASMKIVVKAPLYLKWWFQPLLFILAIGLVSLIAYLVVKSIRNITKRQLVEADLRLSEAEKESFKYKLSSLRAQMDPHFIFNSLNSIQHFITQNDKNAARNYLTKFASLMRLILNSSRVEAISLTEELNTLKLYIDLERLRFDNKFDYQIEVDDEIDADEVEIPTMLLQPYIENAIIHGLKNKENEQGLLKIIVKRQENGILAIIEDNGIGRQKASEIRQQKLETYKSLGMQVTQDRLSLWSTGRQKPTVTIIDLVDQNQMPCGTRVEVYVKVSFFD